MNVEETNNYSEHPIYDRSNWAYSRDPFIELRPTVAASNLSGFDGIRSSEKVRRNVKRGLEEVFIFRVLWIVSVASLAIGCKYG